MRTQLHYLREWNGPPHPDTERLLVEMDRTLQVWEVVDDLIHFIVGPPEVTAYTPDGRPFQFSHSCYTIDSVGEAVDWPLVETLDRPLEAKEFTRLA